MSNDHSHIEELYSLSQFCQGNGIVIYEHSYHYDAFGSWIIVAGSPQKRFRFMWDGKEFRFSAASYLTRRWREESSKTDRTQTQKELFGQIKERIQAL